ncbi:MAG: nucleotidyltransferase substrate binding protein [Sphingomonas sp.]
MDEATPPRWQLRLRNYDSAIEWLREAVELAGQRPLSELEKAGMVQRFEIACELGWKLMADYLLHELVPLDTVTPGGAIRAAFAAEVIRDGDAWMAASRLRNALSHTYDKAVRDRALEEISGRYLPLFAEFRDAMAARRER